MTDPTLIDGVLATPPAAPSRYVVGIDLGTTNSAVGYFDTADSEPLLRTLRIPQLVAAGHVEPRDTLPSFHYQPAPGEFSPESLRLPWGDAAGGFVGMLARDQGGLAPGRLVSSAKSWLCHSGVDRTAPLLPWHGDPDVTRLSPVEASARYLRHMHDAWNAKFPAAPLAQQEIVLTLPASFDEIARELTVRAAALAGLPRIVLIEEPQAAFYAWIHRHREDWEQQVQEGQKILVCDLGGGTSDFTLIRVRQGTDGRLQFHRVAVGDHLLLGGDNLDLALAQFVERKLVGEKRLDPRPWGMLVRICRQVKETLLGEHPPERVTVHVPGVGSRLIGGGLQTEVTREEVEQCLLEGFMPRVAFDEKPATRRSGFQEFGLLYAPDPAMTRYLAAFLKAHAEREPGQAPTRASARPDIVLFNGGVFASPRMRQRWLDVLGGWFSEGSALWSPVVLDHDRLDLAVAHGAAYYGLVRRGQGVRIAAGLARTYYIGVEGDEARAMCLTPAGLEPGQDVVLEQHTFDLLTSQPVEFPLYVSSTRLTDAPGAMVAVDREQMTPLPPLRTVIHSSGKSGPAHVPVQLHVRLTEIGTLDLWCASLDSRRRWKLQFDVRSTTRTDLEAHAGLGEQSGFVDEAIAERCRQIIHATFGAQPVDSPDGLVKRLSEAIGASRRDWPATLLRRLWEALMEVEPGRRRSALHEARWLNLLGFALRPGYGLAADDWRVAETRRVLQGKLAHGTPSCQTEWWIFWRRICGGLTAGQHQAWADIVLPQLRQLEKQAAPSRRGENRATSHEAAEMWRLLGALELLSVRTKIEAGRRIVDALRAGRLDPIRPALLWALGRIGARQPAFGPLNTVVPPDVVGGWLQKLLPLGLVEPVYALCLMQMARRTGDRHRDISEDMRDAVVATLTSTQASEHFVQLVAEGGALDADEQGLVFGEALPKGLRVRTDDSR